MQLILIPGEGGISALVVTGEIDMATAGELRAAGIEAVTAEGCAELTIDLSGVDFLDSSGIGALVGIRSAATELGRSVRISAVSDRARQVVVVCGLGPAFGLDAESSFPGP